ncbi:unnamed protein product [Paramecium octaurelia]|uniref:Uncharacterized protein n=1 Tax=Paramecium octaurelia TaxID=43137 RepID=A0A8S1VM33_PAROT|nr:unnamed protein product [Paramecium octaurelia]
MKMISKGLINDQNNSNFMFEYLSSVPTMQQWFWSLKFNYNTSMIFGGCIQKIQLFQFKNGYLKEIAQNFEKNANVCCLSSMNNSNFFISGNEEGIIRIRKCVGVNSPKGLIKLEVHISCITSLLINQQDNIIFSSSMDHQIIIWRKKNEWIHSQIIFGKIGKIYCLSLNQSETQLIACGSCKYIIIIQKSKDCNYWYIINKISLFQYGYRINFVDDSMFVFQPYCQSKLEVFVLNLDTKKFTKTKDIDVFCDSQTDNCFFPIQFVNRKQSILINKNGNYINILQLNNFHNFTLIQSINFNTQCLYGTISNDGEYLVTWNSLQECIQIRKFQEQK